MSDLIKNVNDAELTAILTQSEVPVLLDLWAPWCGPCLAMAPLLEKVAENTAGKLSVVKLDIEQYPEVSARLRVRSIPTLLLLEAGKETSRKVGVESLSDLNQWLRSQGVETESADEVITPAGSMWLSFYQDEELFGFMTRRLLDKAAAGQVAPTHVFPRAEDQSTAFYTMAGTESPEIFERLTGIPPVIALWADFLDYTSVQDAENLVAALSIGKDYSAVPLKLIAYWLNSTEIDWASLLSDKVNNLRLQWLALVAPMLEGGESSRARWVALEAEANRILAEVVDGSEFEKHLTYILAQLSPPLNATDTDVWNTLFYSLHECLSDVLKVRSGWTPEERGYAEIRWQWLEPRIPADTEEDAFEQVIDQLRGEWQQQSPAYQVFSDKEEQFNANFPSLMRTEIAALKQQFLSLMKATPVIE